MRIRGHGGTVSVGYRVVSALGDWTLTRTALGSSSTYALTADCEVVDTFWSQRRPMALRLHMGNRVWEWANVNPDLGEQSLAATMIGAPLIH